MSSNYAPQSIPTRAVEGWIRPNPSTMMTFISSVDPSVQYDMDHQAEQPAQKRPEPTEPSSWC